MYLISLIITVGPTEMLDLKNEYRTHQSIEI